jgi:hypothetical protein
MIELISGIPAPPFGGRIFTSARMRPDSRFQVVPVFFIIIILVKCFRVPYKIFSLTLAGTLSPG